MATATKLAFLSTVAMFPLFLGAAPAKALLYTFSGSFSNAPPLVPNGQPNGSGTFSGSFDYVGSNNITSFNATVTPAGNTIQPFTFTPSNSSLTYNGSNQLVFASTGNNPSASLSFTLGTPLTTTCCAGTTFTSGTYFNSNNTTNGGGNLIPKQTYTLNIRTFVPVPFSPSALLLAPVVLLASRRKSLLRTFDLDRPSSHLPSRSKLY